MVKKFIFILTLFFTVPFHVLCEEKSNRKYLVGLAYPPTIKAGLSLFNEDCFLELKYNPLRENSFIFQPRRNVNIVSLGLHYNFQTWLVEKFSQSNNNSSLRQLAFFVPFVSLSLSLLQFNTTNGNSTRNAVYFIDKSLYTVDHQNLFDLMLDFSIGYRFGPRLSKYLLGPETTRRMFGSTPILRNLYFDITLFGSNSFLARLKKPTITFNKDATEMEKSVLNKSLKKYRLNYLYFLGIGFGFVW